MRPAERLYRREPGWSLDAKTFNSVCNACEAFKDGRAIVVP